MGVIEGRRQLPNNRMHLDERALGSEPPAVQLSVTGSGP
jgi:hypothetical protein